MGPDAFIYLDGQMVDLNSLLIPTSGVPGGVRLSNAVAINDFEQIVSIGSDGNSYLLSPVPNLYESNGNGVKLVNTANHSAVSIASGLSETGGLASTSRATSTSHRAIR